MISASLEPRQLRQDPLMQELALWVDDDPATIKGQAASFYLGLFETQPVCAFEWIDMKLR